MNESKPENPQAADTVATDLNVEIEAMRNIYMAVLAVPPWRRAEVLAWVSKRLELCRHRIHPIVPQDVEAKALDAQYIESVTEKIQRAGVGEPTATIADIRGPRRSPFTDMGTLRQVITEATRHEFGGVTPAPAAMVKLVRSLRDGPDGPTRGFLNVIPDDTLEERITQILEG